MPKTVEQKVIDYFKENRVVFETSTIHAFVSRDRAAAKKVIDDMLAKGVLLKLGQGVRGDPVRYVISPSWPHNVCFTCGHTEALSVDLQKEWPKAESVRIKRAPNRAADALRPTYRQNGSQWEVIGRKPRFGHQGEPIVLFTGSRESCKAYLKDLENQEMEFNNKGERGIYTQYGVFSQPASSSMPFLVITQVQGDWIAEKGFHLQSQATKYALDSALPTRVILCQTGRELEAYEGRHQ